MRSGGLGVFCYRPAWYEFFPAATLAFGSSATYLVFGEILGFAGAGWMPCPLHDVRMLLAPG